MGEVEALYELVEKDEWEPIRVKKGLFGNKHANWLRVYVKTDGKKIWLPPIPLIIINGLVRLVLRFVNIEDIPINKKDINVILKELRKLPPFVIVEVEDKKSNTIVKIETK